MLDDLAIVCMRKKEIIDLVPVMPISCQSVGPLLDGSCHVRFGDTASAPVHWQCPREMQPLVRSIAKNYPASGMLAPGYASGAFKALLRSNNRELTLVEKRRLAEGCPALHEVAARCAWNSIPEELVLLLRLLLRKARIAGSCMEVMCRGTL